jgi:cytosine/creatinine deaminase
MDLLIKNVRIVAKAAPVDIGIKGGRITAIDTSLPGAAGRTIEAGGRAAIPGLVEPHVHLDKAFLHDRMTSLTGTLEEAIRVTGILKTRQEREDVLARSRRVLDMAVTAGVTAMRVHPDVDPIQGLIGLETALQLKQEYRHLLDMQVVAFPQEGILKSPGTLELMEEAMRLGADVVGGCPYAERNAEEAEQHIDIVFALAAKYGAPIDMHADFADDTSDPRFTTCACVARRTIETGYQGRVALGHVTSLGGLTCEEAKPVLAQLAAADITIVTLPATDAYLGGRRDDGRPRRGLTPVRQLREAGVNVAYSSNNIRNAFTPFGKADPLIIGNFLAHLAQFGTPEQQAEILAMGTYAGARAMGVAGTYGLHVGAQADLVVLDTFDVADILLDIPARLFVIKNGRIAVETVHCSTIHRG